LTAFLGIGIESCLLCKGTPSHSHLCPADDYISKKPKAKLHFFFQIPMVKKTKKSHFMIETDKETTKNI